MSIKKIINILVFILVIEVICSITFTHLEAEEKEVVNISTYNDVKTNLDEYYKSLDKTNRYLTSTDKFLCIIGSGCNGSKYNNIGLLNISEYNEIGGLDSYLFSTSSYFSMTENNGKVSNITSNKVEEVTFESESGIKPVLYSKEDVKVIGSGTVDDPFMFVHYTKVNITLWTIDEEEPNEGVEFPKKEDGYKVNKVECENEVIGKWNKRSWTVEVEDTDYKEINCEVDFASPKLGDKILNDNSVVKRREEFDSKFEESNNGSIIYNERFTQEDKRYETYYFAGSVTNNYVKFGQNSNGQDLYWRIVRVNEDDSVRLIYVGESVENKKAVIGSSKYNEVTMTTNSSEYGLLTYTFNVEPSFSGYMYTTNEQHGLSTDSDIKEYIDEWYLNNLNEKYDKYISKTAVYCNDRTTNDTWDKNSSFNYGVYDRIKSKKPTYACDNINDRFTMSKKTGNDALTYPIGLLSSDELIYAGGLEGVNNSSYIYENIKNVEGSLWTMSPKYWKKSSRFDISSDMNMFTYTSDDTIEVGTYNNVGVGMNYYVRPVISLKACVKWVKGNGTKEKPYEIKIDELCEKVPNDYGDKIEFELEEDGEIIIEESGTYILEAWGSQGASYDTTYIGGNGGYISGSIYLEEGTVLKVLVGCQDGTNGGGITSEADARNGGGSSRVLMESITLITGAGGGGASSKANGVAGGSGNGAGGPSGGGGVSGANGGGGSSSVAYTYDCECDVCGGGCASYYPVEQCCTEGDTSGCVSAFWDCEFDCMNNDYPGCADSCRSAYDSCLANAQVCYPCGGGCASYYPTYLCNCKTCTQDPQAGNGGSSSVHSSVTQIDKQDGIKEGNGKVIVKMSY